MRPALSSLTGTAELHTEPAGSMVFWSINNNSVFEDPSDTISLLKISHPLATASNKAYLEASLFQTLSDVSIWLQPYASALCRPIY